MLKVRPLKCKLAEALTKFKTTINCKLIEKSQKDQFKRYSVFDDLRVKSKQKTIAFIVQVKLFLVDDVSTKNYKLPQRT